MGERSAKSSRARRDVFSSSRSSSGSKAASAAASARSSLTFSTRSTTGFSNGRTKAATPRAIATPRPAGKPARSPSSLLGGGGLAGEGEERHLHGGARAQHVVDAQRLLLALHLGRLELLELEAAGERVVGVLADDDLAGQRHRAEARRGVRHVADDRVRERLGA